MNDLVLTAIPLLWILFIIAVPTVYVIVRQYLKAKRKENGEP